MGGVEGEIEEKGLFGFRFMLLGNPVLCSGGEKIGGVAFVETCGNFLVVFPYLLGSAIRAFFGVVFMAVNVPERSEEFIEAPAERMCWELGRLAREAPLADASGGISRSF